MLSLRVIDTDTGYWLDATEADAPQLHEAWAAWINADHGSSSEQHRWSALLDAAQDYFDDCGCDGNEAGNVCETPSS